MLNKGDGSIFKVGELAMNNQKGVSNLNITNSINTGKGSESDIGLLQNLVINYDGEQYII